MDNHACRKKNTTAFVSPHDRHLKTLRVRFDLNSCGLVGINVFHNVFFSILSNPYEIGITEQGLPNVVAHTVVTADDDWLVTKRANKRERDRSCSKHMA